jgi:hypothetical protein
MGGGTLSFNGRKYLILWDKLLYIAKNGGRNRIVWAEVG